MKKLTLCLSASLIALASTLADAAPKVDCGPWAKYMADTVAPVMGIGLPVGVWGAGTGMGGYGAWLPLLSDGVKAGLGESKGELTGLYNQTVIALNESMTEAMEEWKKTAAEHPGSPFPMMAPPSKKVQDLQKKYQTAVEAFKKRMFAFGSKQGCTSDFETEVGKNLIANNANTSQMFQSLLAQKEKRIAGLTKAADRAATALEECRKATPSIATKMQKALDGITDAIEKQEDACPLCTSGGFGAAGAGRF